VASSVARYLDLLDEQREAIFRELGPLPGTVLWYRPGPRVWSFGEHLDHTRVHNRSSRRFLPIYFWAAWIFARVFRDRAYKADFDDPCNRPNYPKNIGWIWRPEYTPQRPVSVGFLHEGLRAEHAAHRGFYTAHDERLLGHVMVADPFLGVFNLVQWLRYLAYHDAHHYERVRGRINDPEYGRAAAAAKELKDAGRGQ
jgi:hypothetical protein